jgi:dCTP deaminase
LHVDRYFRVFRNDTTPFIDPKEPQEDLTELVEVDDGRAFILHPGEFVLGSTLERVALPDDLVARLEGKSSLGRLGLLIHSSLPASELVMTLVEGRLEARPIGDVVRKRLDGYVAAFDRDTLEVAFHPITDWIEGPADRIFEVHLASGRRVRVTAGHNLFSLGRGGEVIKVRTGELAPGTFVAIPRRIPDPPQPATSIEVMRLVPESEFADLACFGPSIARAFEARRDEVHAALTDEGYRHFDYYRERSRLPLPVARQITGLVEDLGARDQLATRGSNFGLPLCIEVDEELAWGLGLYIAEGSRRRTQFTISNLDQHILDRAETLLTRYSIPTSRTPRQVTGCSKLFSSLLGWLGIGTGAYHKRIPPTCFSWPTELLSALLDGLVDGDGSRETFRTSVWTASDGLRDDLLLLAARLGLRAASSSRSTRKLHQVQFPVREHKLLTTVPLPDLLLREARGDAGVHQLEASRLAGYRHASDLNNIEQRCGRDAVRFATLRRLRDAYQSRAPASPAVQRIHELADGDLLWDRVVEVRDTGEFEEVFDLEVRLHGRKIENFVAGAGGVIVSNTAGFVDAGWDGHLTLELSNVANLPIAIYPGMKIGQISFLRMTSAAEHAYGSSAMGSKYQGQRGPTPSRYYLNFRDRD